MTAYFDGFYLSEREHVEHVDGITYRVPADVWFTAVRGLRYAYDMPGSRDAILLTAPTKDELRQQLKRYAPHAMEVNE